MQGLGICLSNLFSLAGKFQAVMTIMRQNGGKKEEIVSNLWILIPTNPKFETAIHNHY